MKISALWRKNRSQTFPKANSARCSSSRCSSSSSSSSSRSAQASRISEVRIFSAQVSVRPTLRVKPFKAGREPFAEVTQELDILHLLQARSSSSLLLLHVRHQPQRWEGEPFDDIGYRLCEPVMMRVHTHKTAGPCEFRCIFFPRLSHSAIGASRKCTKHCACHLFHTLADYRARWHLFHTKHCA